MIIHREIGSSYHHKPIAQGVDYSPLIMEIDEEVLVKEERRPEAIPAAVPPPVFLRRRLADSLFGVFDLRLRIFAIRVGGTLYRQFLGQTKLVARKLTRNGPRKAERHLVARPRGVGAPAHLLGSLLTSWWPTLAHLVRLKISETWALSLLNSESRNSSKVKNTKKKVYCLEKLNTDKDDFIGKSPKII